MTDVIRIIQTETEVVTITAPVTRVVSIVGTGPQGPAGPEGPQGLPGSGLSDTDALPEGVVNLYYTEARVAANSAVAANTTHRGLTDNPHSVTPTQLGLVIGTDVQAYDADLDAWALIAPSAKADASHTHPASDVTDFDTEVSNNTSVAANTSHRGLTNNPHGVTPTQLGLVIGTDVQAYDADLDAWALIAPSAKADASHTHPASEITDFDTEVGNNSAVAANTSHAAVVTGNPHAVTKSEVGLANVPNTDATDRANHTGTQVAATISDFDTEVGNNSAVAANTTHAAVVTGNPHAVTKGEVGLGNVPNTDATARANHTGTQTASTISNFDSAVAANSEVAANTTHRGLTNNPHSVTKTQVGLANVPNVDTSNAANISSGVLDNARVNFASPDAIGSGTPNTGTFTSVIANNLYSFQANIADDALGIFPVGVFAGGRLFLSGNTSTAAAGDFFIRTQATTGIRKDQQYGSLTIDVTTGILSAGSGTDGRVTISCHTDGNVYISNRSGGVFNFKFLIIR